MIGYFFCVTLGLKCWVILFCYSRTLMIGYVVCVTLVLCEKL